MRLLDCQVRNKPKMTLQSPLIAPIDKTIHGIWILIEIMIQTHCQEDRSKKLVRKMKKMVGKMKKLSEK